MTTKDDLFGLLDAQANVFYVVSRDYHIIKLMQMLLLRHKLFPCVNLSRLDSDQLDLENCKNFGVTKPLTKFLNPDPDTSIYGSAVVKTQNTTHSVLEKNLILLLGLISGVERFVDDFEIREHARFRDMINGLVETKKFIYEMIPGDPNIEDFVRQEISTKEKMIYRSREIRNSLFAMLMDSDFWDPDWSSTIKNQLMSLTSTDTDLVKSFKMICMRCL